MALGQRFSVGITSIITGGIVSGTSSGTSGAAGVVTYEGPTLASYRTSGTLGPFLTPAWESDDQYYREFQGREWTSVWKGVYFPTTGVYKLKCEADDWLRVYIDDVEIGNPPKFAAQFANPWREYSFNASKGIHNIRMDYYNIPGDHTRTFWNNQVVFAAEITDKISVETGHSKSWVNNPIGISAVLLPPPCPRIVEGKGKVVKVDVDLPGNGPPTPGIGTTGYPVRLDLPKIPVKTPGINYDCREIGRAHV